MVENSKLFKDVFFKASFINELSAALNDALPSFNKPAFVKNVFNDSWHNKELKQRVSHIVDVLEGILPGDYSEAVNTIQRVVKHLKEQNIKEVSFGYVCLPEYIERHGLQHFAESVKALEYCTQFITSEFAVRPFILKYEDRMIRQMIKWSKHSNAKVRRLASEGCRPRLPWAIALPAFKKDPTAILPILENLKTDNDIWVQKSVANNLNDISKDNPTRAKNIFSSWLGHNETTDWIVKHAARTLLKKGDKDVMQLFGLNKDDTTSIETCHVITPKVKIGEYLQFSFNVVNAAENSRLIRLEYAIYYLLSNGKHSRKVFKISEKEYPAFANINVKRKQSFKPITTRTYYRGIQKVSVILNGHEYAAMDFKLC